MGFVISDSVDVWWVLKDNILVEVGMLSFLIWSSVGVGCNFKLYIKFGVCRVCLCGLVCLVLCCY